MISDTQKFLEKTLATISREEVLDLQKVIQYHRELYYNDAPIISDQEFDQLYALLVAAEEKFHLTHADSPTQEVARLEQTKFTKAAHLTPMMSLDNTYDADDLRDFEKRIERLLQSAGERIEPLEYVMEYKFDGLGIALLYEE